MRSSVALADRALGASPATGGELEGATRGGVGKLGLSELGPRPGHGSPYGGARRGRGLHGTPVELRLAQPERTRRVAAAGWRSPQGPRSCAPPRARWRRLAGRAAPLRTPPQQRHRSPARTSATPSRAAAVPRSVASTSGGSPAGTRSRAPRAWAIAVALSPSSPASCERRSASCVGMVGRINRSPSLTVAVRAFRVAQPFGDAFGLAGKEEHPRVGRTQLGVATDDLGGQSIQPAPHRAQLARVEVPARGGGDEQARALEVAREERMADRLVVVPVRLVPGRRSGVQLGDLAGVERSQPGAQDLGKERVVPIPASLVVERDDQEVGALELLEARLAFGYSGDGIAQRTAQAVKDRGAQQEFLGLARQSGENLLDDIVQDVAVARPEPPHQVGMVGSAAEGDRCEPQRGSPPLGSLGELFDLRGGKLDAGRADERSRLGRREAEVLGANLEQLAAGPQAGERERWIGARCDREPGSRRKTLDEGCHEAMDGRLLDDVVVIEHEHRAASGRCKAVEDGGKGELGVEGPGVELPGALRFARQARRRRGEVSSEPDDVVVARVERQPRAADGRLIQPVGQQGALAEAGRRGDEHEASLGGGVELGPQPLAVDVAPAPRLGAELRRDQGISPWHRHRDRQPSRRAPGQDESPAVSGPRSRTHSAVRRDLDVPMSASAAGPESTRGPIDGWMRPRGVEPQAPS